MGADPIDSPAMEQRKLGRSGLSVSRLALGTMTWGRDTDEHEAGDQMSAFLDAGGTLVDTAAGYGTGERVVDTSRKALLDALDGSLQRMGVDTVDLWQVHAWSDDTTLEETLAAVDSAVSTGRARYVGVSNYSGWQTARAATWQQVWPGRAPVVSTQMEYSLLQRGIEREVLPAAEALGLGVLPWSPLGAGVLTGKYRGGTPADSRAASPHFGRFLEARLDDRARRIVDAVATAAEGLEVSPLAVALAWVRDAPGVTAPVVGARTAAQLLASLEADQVTLPAEIRRALDEVSAPATGYPDS